MNALQRLELFLTGKAYVGHRRLPGWSKTLPFFAFKCPIHGLVEDYVSGHPHNSRNGLDCPRCRNESVHPDLVEQVVQEVLDG